MSEQPAPEPVEGLVRETGPMRDGKRRITYYSHDPGTSDGEAGDE